jgi:hypothetical protein
MPRSVFADTGSMILSLRILALTVGACMLASGAMTLLLVASGR